MIENIIYKLFFVFIYVLHKGQLTQIILIKQYEFIKIVYAKFEKLGTKIK